MPTAEEAQRGRDADAVLRVLADKVIAQYARGMLTTAELTMSTDRHLRY
jgi:hypothetical protein